MYIPGKFNIVHMEVLAGLIKTCVDSRKTDSRIVKSKFCSIYFYGTPFLTMA
jgi:hypothetical protein